MKKSAFLLCLYIFYVSCAPKFYPLQGNYPTSPVTGYTPRSSGDAWNAIIEFLKQKDLSFKTDSVRGLIVSKNARLPASYENEDGKLNLPSAYIVLPRHDGPSDFKARMPSFFIEGDWVIQVKKGVSNTSVVVELKNMKAFRGHVHDSRGDTDILFNPKASTTGVFENEIFDQIR